ncbi:hypothetical protein B0E46_11340 [Rhodanobacter sp. B04]|nr:hypothetical protein B0E46_11340 [Rhodanobacter sp. B04]
MKRGFHLLPHVPRQHAAHPTCVKVIHHTYPVRLAPVLDRLQPSIEQVRIEVRQRGTEIADGRHGATRVPPHADRCALVLHPQAVIEYGIEEIGDVAGRPDVEARVSNRASATMPSSTCKPACSATAASAVLPAPTIR